MAFLRNSTIRLSLLVLASGIQLFAQRSREIYNGREVVENEVVIRLKDASDPALLNLLGAMLPADSLQVLNQELGLVLVHSPTRPVGALLDLFANRGDLFYAEPNFTVQTVANPNDPYLGQMWGLQKSGASLAWDISRGNRSSVVGVVDTGVNYNHPDLAANMWSAPAAFTVKVGTLQISCPAGSHGLNAISMTCDPADDNGHGSHVAGTIGAVGDNNIGVAGMSWASSIMALKFLDSGGSGSVSNAIRAINFAIQVKRYFAGTTTPVNVRVLSNSWSGSGYSQALLDAINSAGTNDMLFVAAAGNSAANDDVAKAYPASYDAANLVTVAATDSSDSLAGFSSYGATTVHLAAPGVGILSTYLGDGYASLSGTSMATPHVAGAAALTLSGCPDLKTSALKDILLKNVDLVPALAGRTSSGGRLNVNNALRACNASRQPALSSVVIGPSTLQSGQSGSIVVSLTGTAVSPGMTVALSSSNPASVSVPASVTIPTGSTTATISFTAGTVTSSTPFTITASAYGVSRAASGTLGPKMVSVSIKTSPANQSLVVDGTAYNSAQVFQWTAGSSHSIGAAAQNAGAGTQFVWMSWSDGGAQTHTIASTKDAEFVANFKTQYLLSTVVTPSDAGVITASPASATGYYDAGSNVQLSVLANGNYTLLNWAGDLLGSALSQTVTMSAPRSITATFLLPAPVIVPPVSIIVPPAAPQEPVVTPPPPPVVTPPPSLTPSADDFVTGYALSGPALRNDFAGWVGMKMTVGGDAMLATSLGRLCVAGNNGLHTVKFVNALNGSDVPGGSISVNMASCTAGQFQFATLPSPITLPAGTSYYLVSQEFQGGDRWDDVGQISTMSDATVNSGVYSSNGTTWIGVGGANNSYVPPSFQYTVVDTPQGSPLVTGFNSYSPLRNDYGGWVGMKFTVNKNSMDVSSLGRICVAGNSGVHTVKLVNSATGADIPGGSAQVNMAGCTPGQFSYAALPAPIALKGKTAYQLVSQETVGGDRWYDYGTISSNPSVTVNGPIYSLLGFWISLSAPSMSYVPLNLK